MAGRPEIPGGGTPGREREREGAVVAERRPKVARPPKFKVILYNDDYTPMEFVVAVLEQVFGKGPTEATQLMLETLFVVRAKVSESHAVAVGIDDEDEDGEEEEEDA